MSAVWSDEQQRCLAALDYTLYRTAALPVPAAQTAGAATAIDPLLRALLRAANRSHAQIDTDAWMISLQIPLLSELRNDPAAKRTLWPRLRASRRERDPS